MIEQKEYKFPDEVEQEKNAAPEYDIEIVDDTPEEDRKGPMEPQRLEQLERETEDSELEKYDKATKEKFRALKRAFHDERRAKEIADKERNEAVEVARRAHYEAQRLKSTLDYGYHEYAAMSKSEADYAIKSAEKSLKDAYDLGDSEKIVEAQKELNVAQLKLDRALSFNPKSIQIDRGPQNPPQSQQQQRVEQGSPQYHPRTQEWMNDNRWYGSNTVMTATAQGVHMDLVRHYGEEYSGSDEYFKKLDTEMRKRFPEEFDGRPTRRRSDGSNVVASATRSNAPRKITLNPRQASIIKKLGITPEQYVTEYLKVST